MVHFDIIGFNYENQLSSVLILLVMDGALRLSFDTVPADHEYVLILLVMDGALRPYGAN